MKADAPKRKIVITGVTRGLGRAMASEFARLGHTVIGCGRSKGEIETLRKELGAPHDFEVVDVASDAEVKSWAAQVAQKFGAPHLLLNNAAVINKNAPLWEVSAEEFSRVMDVNVKGTVNVLRHFIPSLVKANAGVVVNFSSGWGRSTDAEVAPYCASKWAIEGLTQSLAQEVPKGIAAVTLNPGVINTDMLRSSFGDSAAGYVGPEDWAKTAAPYLLKIEAKDNGRQLTAP
jgi:NAD(P)-dependent dehydrogenase (short-subunit alcohol dehydrogenase family)